MFYKTCFVVCAFITITVATSYDITMVGSDKATNACRKELRPSKKQYTLQNTRKEPKCLNHCAGLKLNLFTEIGDPILNNFHHITFVPGITEYARDCSNQLTETEKCERVNMVMACVQDKFNQTLQGYGAECAAETQIVVEDVMEYLKTVMNSKNNTNCYNRCLLLKSNVIDANSNFKLQKFMPYFSGSKYADFDKKLEKCMKEITHKDSCSKATYGVGCIYRVYYLGLIG